jgi:hypothetical protein
MIYNIRVMKKVTYINSIATTVLCLLLLITTASANEGDALPAFFNTYSCTICHDSESFSNDLNSFGVDYLEFGWGAYLASLDSDGDGCKNGIELGDDDGNGSLDPGSDGEFGNPGQAGDCVAAGVIDEATWGSLKALFSSR